MIFDKGYVYHHRTEKRWYTVAGNVDIHGKNYNVFTNSDNEQYIGVYYLDEPILGYIKTLRIEDLDVVDTKDHIPFSVVPVASSMVEDIDIKMYQVSEFSYCLKFKRNGKTVLVDYRNRANGISVLYSVLGHFTKHRGLKHLYEHVKCEVMGVNNKYSKQDGFYANAWTGPRSLTFVMESEHYKIGLNKVSKKAFYKTELGRLVSKMKDLITSDISLIEQDVLDREKKIVENESEYYARMLRMEYANKSSRVVTNAILQLYQKELEGIETDKISLTAPTVYDLLGDAKEIKSYGISDLVRMEKEIYSEDFHCISLSCDMDLLIGPNENNRDSNDNNGNNEKMKVKRNKEIFDAIISHVLPLASSALSKMCEPDVDYKPDYKISEVINAYKKKYGEVKEVVSSSNFKVIESSKLHKDEMIVTLVYNKEGLAKKEGETGLSNAYLDRFSKNARIDRCIFSAIRRVLNRKLRDDAMSLYAICGEEDVSVHDKGVPLEDFATILRGEGVVNTNNGMKAEIVTAIKEVKELLDSNLKGLNTKHLEDAIDNASRIGIGALNSAYMRTLLGQNKWSLETAFPTHADLIVNQNMLITLLNDKTLASDYFKDVLKPAIDIVVIVDSKDEELKEMLKNIVGKEVMLSDE